MNVGRRRSRALRCIVLSVAAGGLLSGCNREMRGTLRDLGFHVDEPTAESTTAPPSPQAQTAPLAQAATSTTAVPVTAAPPAPGPSAPVVAAAPTAAAPLPAPVPAQAPVALGDLHSGWIAGTLGEVPQPMVSMKSFGSPYGTVKIDYRGKAGGTHGTVTFTTALLKPTPLDVEDEHEKSAVFAVKLPVGDYVIDSLHFTDSNDLYGRNCKVEHKLAVPFTVIPGTVNYLGALLTSADWGGTNQGPEAPVCGYFIVKDQSARDEPMVRHHYGELAGPFVVNLLAGNTPESEKFFRGK